MCWSTWTLRGKGMALQAQQIDLAHSQETRIRGTMGRVASGAAFCLDRNMFVYERTAGIGVTLRASRISVGLGLDLTKRGGAVNIVAVTAMNESFIDAMVIGPGKLSLCSCMARIALRGLFLNEQMLRLFRMMWRMAVKTTHGIAGVGRTGEMLVFQVLTMTTETARTGFFARQSLETDDFGGIASASHVFRSGAVA